MQFDRYRLILAATIGLGVAGSAFAQQTPTPAPDSTAAPATEAPAAQPPAADAAKPADGTDGNPAAAEVREIIRDTFGDWQVRCMPQGNDCFLYQMAFDSNKVPVAEVTLLKLPKGSQAVAGVTVISPLYTLLTAGVGVQVDNNDVGRFPFNWCSKTGCFARFGLTDQTVATLKHGKTGRMTLVSIEAPDHPLALNLSLTGFTAAYDSLETPVAPAGTPAPAPAAPSLAPANPAPLAPKP